MAGTRTIFALSALLGIAGFVVALSALPVDHAPARAARERVRSVPTIEEATTRIRSALTQGRPERAFNIATRASEIYPQEPEAWFWKVVTSVRLGTPSEAAGAGEQLRTLINANPPPLHLAAQSRREYRLGWPRADDPPDRQRRNGVEIPQYCYHDGLSIVASCRICLARSGRPPRKTGSSSPSWAAS
jgi:hypothetical protein